MTILKPRNIPFMLAWLMRFTLYLMSLCILGLAVIMAVEAPMPRGTIQWLSSNGISQVELVSFTLICGALGILFTRRVRHSFLGTMILYFIVTLPYIFFSAASSIYIINVQGASRIIAWMYLIGYLFAFLLVVFVSLLSTWAGMNKFKGNP